MAARCHTSQPAGKGRDTLAANYFRENPQRLQLGLIRLILKKADGSEVGLTDIESSRHELLLRAGRIRSRFKVEGVPVSVDLYCHQRRDMVAVWITSPLIAEGRLKVEWRFPYAVPINTHSGYDFTSVERHGSRLERIDGYSARITRQLDANRYQVRIEWAGDATLDEVGRHDFVLVLRSVQLIEFSSLFSPQPSTGPLPGFAETERESLESLGTFWRLSGVVDLSGSTDPRAAEIERRFILSQYLTIIQSSGKLPPQETGLVRDS